MKRLEQIEEALGQFLSALAELPLLALESIFVLCIAAIAAAAFAVNLTAALLEVLIATGPESILLLAVFALSLRRSPIRRIEGGAE